MKQKLSESQARSCHAQKEKEEFAGLAVKRGQTIQVCKLADHNEDIRDDPFEPTKRYFFLLSQLFLITFRCADYTFTPASIVQIFKNIFSHSPPPLSRDQMVGPLANKSLKTSW